MGSKVLVAYATRTGCTEGVARRIAQALTQAGAQVDVQSLEDDPNPAQYGAVVVGSGARAGSWHKAAQSWTRKNAEILKTKPLALFTVGMRIKEGPQHTDEVLGYTKKLLDETGLNPIDVGLFAGWFTPDKFSFFERTILKTMKIPEGDFRDFAAIDAWAHKIAKQLISPS